MSTQVESALNTLLPTLSFLPPDVIHLSKSLLAQSKSKAASLKPEEEIGRTYACCNIACERLKLRLNLDDINVAPPVKPALYRKLYAYLDGALRTPVSVRTTPRSSRNTSANPTPASTRTTRLSNTPSARAAVAETAPAPTPSRRTPGGLKRARPDDSNGDLPWFASPLTHAICKHCGRVDAAPHVLNGLQSVLPRLDAEAKAAESQAGEEAGAPSKRRRTSARSAQGQDAQGFAANRIPVLVYCLYRAVVKRMYSRDYHEERESVEALRAMYEYLKQQKQALPPQCGDEGMMEDMKLFDKQAKDLWHGMDWYLDVPADGNPQEGVATDEDTRSSARPRPTKTPLRRKEKRSQQDHGDLGPAGLLPGLGTMFQPAVDWLSEQRRDEFAVWKEDMMEQVALIEQRSLA
ncbi:hypothetical protein MBLNU230_g2090t1 [Neophaeotheca triangularis]